jgi:hydrogenase maturation protease
VSAHFLRPPGVGPDPAFLRDERVYLNRERAALSVMERHRDDLAGELKKTHVLAGEAGIPWERALGPDEERLLAVIGVGDRSHRDDGAGLEVARRLREADPAGVEILDQRAAADGLLEAWSRAHEALVVECVSSGAAPGTVRRFEVGEEHLPADVFRHPRQALGVAAAVKEARELAALPGRLVVYAIEGEDFGPSEGLTQPVQEAVDQLVAELEAELEGGDSRA